ncbi:hypothetical protein GGF37_005067, partial [Kickxella alabastrina]
APGPGPGPGSAPHGSRGDGFSRVERPVYVKALQAYALQGDVPTLLHLMARHAHLNDIAAWTQLVRGVCMQISNSPTDQLLLHPPGTKACSALEASGAAPSWVDFLMNLALALAPRGVVFTQVTFGSIVQVAAQLGSLREVSRIVRFMQAHSAVRFNVDMLRMVLRIACPFALKCALVKSALQLEPRLPPTDAQSTVRPDNKLLSAVVRMVAEEPDFAELRALAALFWDRRGIALLDMDYDWLIALCRELGLGAEASFWADHRVVMATARGIPVDGEMVSLRGGLA